MQRIIALLALVLCSSAFGNGHVLREDHATQIDLGPFVDGATGLTAQEALTVGDWDCDLIKHADSSMTNTALTITASGGNNDAVHVVSGMYSLELTATDTNTAGRLTIICDHATPTTFVSVRQNYMVMPQQQYDSLYGTDALQVHVTEMAAGVVTATVMATDSIGSDEVAATALAEINTEVDTALSDIRLDELLAADSDIDGAAPPTVGSVFHEALTSTAGSFTYDQTTDSPEAIRNRGDAAWTTGAGGDPSLQSTTVASVTSQTILVATATPTYIDQINGWAVYLEDAGDADAYHIAKVTDYDQSTGAVTISEAAPFTVAASDTMVFIPAFLDEGVDVASWGGVALATTNPLPNAAPDAAGGLVVSDTGGVDIDTLETNVAAAAADAASLNDTKIPDTLSLANINAQADTALSDYDPPTNAEMTAAIDALPTAAENATEALSQQRVLTGTCDSGSTTTCVDNALTQADATQLADRLICFDDSWCALIDDFTPGTDTVTTAKTAPSTRASKAYTIFPATAL